MNKELKEKEQNINPYLWASLNRIRLNVNTTI